MVLQATEVKEVKRPLKRFKITNLKIKESIQKSPTDNEDRLSAVTNIYEANEIVYDKKYNTIKLYRDDYEEDLHEKSNIEIGSKKERYLKDHRLIATFQNRDRQWKNGQEDVWEVKEL